MIDPSMSLTPKSFKPPPEAEPETPPRVRHVREL